LAHGPAAVLEIEAMKMQALNFCFFCFKTKEGPAPAKEHMHGLQIRAIEVSTDCKSALSDGQTALAIC
jgi:hypothetical protein